MREQTVIGGDDAMKPYRKLDPYQRPSIEEDDAMKPNQKNSQLKRFIATLAFPIVLAFNLPVILCGLALATTVCLTALVILIPGIKAAFEAWMRHAPKILVNSMRRMLRVLDLFL